MDAFRYPPPRDGVDPLDHLRSIWLDLDVLLTSLDVKCWSQRTDHGDWTIGHHVAYLADVDRYVIEAATVPTKCWAAAAADAAGRRQLSERRAKLLGRWRAGRLRILQSLDAHQVHQVQQGQQLRQARNGAAAGLPDGGDELPEAVIARLTCLVQQHAELIWAAVSVHTRNDEPGRTHERLAFAGRS